MKRTNAHSAARWMACLGMLTLATACGGGSDGASGASLKQFAGVWLSPCTVINARNSGQTQLNIRANSTTDTQFNGIRTTVVFNNTRCEGSGDAQRFYYVIGNAAGARPTALGEANMVVLYFRSSNGQDTTTPAEYNDLMLMNGGRLYFGNRAQIAADGYPTEIDPSSPWTNQPL